MKNKNFMITVVLAVMMALTGIATADQVNVYEPTSTNAPALITLKPGDSTGQVYDLVVSGFQCGTGSPIPTCNTSPVSHTLTYNIGILYNPGGATTSDIILTFNERIPASGYGSAPFGWTQEGPLGGSEILDVRFTATGSAPAKAVYDVSITDSNGITTPYKVTITTTTIPEFPTVALPIAAVIGLVFLFQQKKKKEE